MSAALSPIPMMSSPFLRFGVWRPLLNLMQGAGAIADGANWRAEWLLQRHNALTPRQLMQVYATLCLGSLSLALVFWIVGAALVLPFACIELLAIGAALLVYARHAADRDHIAMRAHLVRVEQHRAGQVSCVEFNPRWVRIEPEQHDGSLVRLSGQGRSVVVGEFVQPQHRRQLADEFRWALRKLDDEAV